MNKNKFHLKLDLNVGYLILLMSLSIVYGVTESLSELLVFEGISASLIWPPAGLAFAMVLHLGIRYLPVIFIGAMISKMGGVSGDTVLDAFTTTNILIAIGKMVEVYIGAFLFRHVIGKRNALLRTVDVSNFLLISVTMAFVGAGLGALILCAGGVPWNVFGAILKTWWIGDCVGILIVTPVFLGWIGKSVIPVIKVHRIELFALGTSVVLGGAIVFGILFEGITFPVYFLIPALLWAAMRFGRRLTAIASCIVSIIAIWATLNGMGQLVDDTQVYVTLQNLQAFIGILSVMVYVLATAFAERKLAETDANQLRNSLSNIIDSMPSVLMGVDEYLKITHWNAMASERFGVSKNELKDTIITEIDQRFINLETHIFQSIRSGKIYKESMNGANDSGDMVYENITIYPLLDQNSSGAVIRIDDVTKEEEMLLQLNHSRKMDAIGQLVGGVAHDFNNMLGGIFGGVQLLKSPSVNLSEKGVHYADIIMQSATRAADLTSKLLAFGHKGKFVSTAIDIHKVIDDTVEILSRTIDKQITLLANKQAKYSSIIGDDSALENAFINMGINAGHAMPNGGTLTIETNTVVLDESFCSATQFDVSPGNYIEIIMSDTGVGIPARSLSKIFEPFFTTRDQGEGTGLGLAAVYSMVTDHRGAITVNSLEGNGTTFTIYLPTEDVDVEQTFVEKPIVKGKGGILVVDDEEIIQLTIVPMLEELGYVVLSARNGVEALECYEKNQKTIDLILLDMIMPVMNGRETFWKLKEINENCKVIITTGFAQDGSMTDLKKGGVCDIVKKPFRMHELSEKLKEYIVKQGA